MSLQLGQEVRHDAVVLCEEAVLGAPLLHHSKLPLFKLCEPDWALSVLHSRPRSDLRYISHDRANVTPRSLLKRIMGSASACCIQTEQIQFRQRFWSLAKRSSSSCRASAYDASEASRDASEASREKLWARLGQHAGELAERVAHAAFHLQATALQHLHDPSVLPLRELAARPGQGQD